MLPTRQAVALPNLVATRTPRAARPRRGGARASSASDLTAAQRQRLRAQFADIQRRIDALLEADDRLRGEVRAETRDDVRAHEIPAAEVPSAYRAERMLSAVAGALGLPCGIGTRWFARGPKGPNGGHIHGQYTPGDSEIWLCADLSVAELPEAVAHEARHVQQWLKGLWGAGPEARKTREDDAYEFATKWINR
jgi:hypothetical protein